MYKINASLFENRFKFDEIQNQYLFRPLERREKPIFLILSIYNQNLKKKKIETTTKRDQICIVPAI